MSIIGSTDFPIDPAVTSGSDLAARLNRFQAAYSSGNLNGTRPPSVTPGGLWTRDNGDGSKDLYMYNGTSDTLMVSISTDGTIDNSNSSLNNLRYPSMRILSDAPLSITDKNALISFASTDTSTSLPLASSFPSGSGFTLAGSAVTGALIVNRAGVDTISTPNGGSATSFTIAAGETAEFISNGGNAWMVVMGSALIKGLPSFEVVKASAGYQKLPSGLILKWGTGTTSGTATDQTITFSTAFPNACLRAVACAINLSPSAAIVSVSTLSPANITVRGLLCVNNALVTVPLTYLAIGH
jgi:hypothetical protein